MLTGQDVQDLDHSRAHMPDTERIEITPPDTARLPSEIVAPEDSQDLEELFSSLDLLELSRKQVNEPDKRRTSDG